MRCAPLALLLMATIATAQDDKGIKFKGIPLGGTIAEFKIAIPDAKCSSSCMYFSSDCIGRGNVDSLLACQERNKWGPINPRHISTSFDGDKLAEVRVSFQSGSFAMLKSALVTRYGAPTSESTVDLQTRGGMQLKGGRVRWERDGDVLSIDQYGSSIENGYAVLQTLQREKDQLEKMRERINRSTKDL